MFNPYSQVSTFKPPRKEIESKIISKNFSESKEGNHHLLKIQMMCKTEQKISKLPTEILR